MYVSQRRDAGAAGCFFTRALATTKVLPVEVTTDKAAVYPHVVDELARVRGTVGRPTPTTGCKPITGSSRVACDRCAA